MSERKQKNRHQSAFTLIEVMVVVIVIGVLAAMIVPQLMSRSGKAKSAAAKRNIASIELAVNLFQGDYGRFPETLEELIEQPADVADEQWTPPALKPKDLADPWGNPYVYRYPGENGAFDLLSTGADASLGGSGEAADINNWE